MLADQRGPQDLAGIARGRLSAAHQSEGRDGGRVVVQVYATDGGRGIVPGIEERAFDSTSVSPTGAARQGPRDGGLPGVCALGHFETSAEAPTNECPKVIPKQR